jgi:protein gp37
MADKSFIEWTNSTWNVVTGCDKVSPGCKNCYAERYAMRLKKIGVRKYSNGFKLTLHPDVLDYPLSLKAPRMIDNSAMLSK